MSIADRMFSRSNHSCPLRSDCSKESDRRYFDTLFTDNWEVFVIRRKNEGHEFEWFTLCCEAAEH